MSMNARPNSLLIRRNADLAAQLLVERLLAVANGEQREAAVENRPAARPRAVVLRDRGLSAGEDHALRREPREGCLGRIERLRSRK